MEPKQIQPNDKVEYVLVLTVRQCVNDEQNMVCYDGLLGIYPTLNDAIKTAKHLRKQAIK